MIKENGRSMVEMLGVLAIIGVLSAGALAGYSKAMFQHKINKTIDQIMQSVIKTQTLFINEPEATKYKDLRTEKAVEYHLIDSSKSNVFKGDFKIGDHGDSDFSLHLTLPSKACTALASYNWGSKDSNLVGIVVNPSLDGDAGNLGYSCSGIGKSAGEGYYACSDSIPMPMEYVTVACACEGLNCEIILKFR